MIIPRSHDLHLTDSNDQTLAAVGLAIRDAIRHLRQAVGDVSYNLVFRTAPYNYSGAFHWHVNIWPKLVTTAGFERGTGVLINIVPPETAAQRLRDVAVHA
jgi:UDPglucose--hexose-1-phosphate uridylyltransferase